MTLDLLAQKDRVETWLRMRPRQLSSLSFVNIFLWSQEFQFEFKEFGESLAVFATNKVGTFLYLPPLGKSFNLAVAEQCFDFMQEKNRGKGVSRIENVSEAERQIFPEDKFSFFPKGQEYLYQRQDLVELQGQEYKSKRHDHNYFEKHYDSQVLEFVPEMAEECHALFDRWASQRKQTHTDKQREQRASARGSIAVLDRDVARATDHGHVAPDRASLEELYVYMLEDNRAVHRLGIQYSRELGLVGRVVVVKGKIAAYTFGYPLTEDIFCVLFEVADLSFRGIAVYIFTELCRDPQVARFKFINVMDDFGVKNLEKTKLSFRPAALIPAYAVSRRT